MIIFSKKLFSYLASGRLRRRGEWIRRRSRRLWTTSRRWARRSRSPGTNFYLKRSFKIMFFFISITFQSTLKDAWSVKVDLRQLFKDVVLLPVSTLLNKCSVPWDIPNITDVSEVLNHLKILGIKDRTKRKPFKQLTSKMNDPEQTKSQYRENLKSEDCWQSKNRSNFEDSRKSW